MTDSAFEVRSDISAVGFSTDTTMVSRFVRQDDPRVEQVIFNLPSTWWSRPFEYAWAQNFVRDSDVVLDAACGISHPFKLWLADHAAKTHACDMDKRILSDEMIRRDILADFGEAASSDPLLQQRLDRVERACADLRSLPYADGVFDRIFCISVLEHLQPDARIEALSSMSRTLKAGGKIVLTFDVPNLDPGLVTNILSEAGLAIDGVLNTWRFEDSITSSMWGSPLYCFRTVARKV